MAHHAQILTSRRGAPGIRRASSHPLLFLPVWLSFGLGLLSLGWVTTGPAASASLDSLVPRTVSGAAADLSTSTPPSANASTELSNLFSPEVLVWEADILHWADQHDLDPNLVATVMQIESCGHPSARSSAGAMGLFQVMPFHFQPGENPLDPDTNARRGLAYLSRALQLAHGRVELALAGYNGGHGVIHRDITTWAAEIQRYVRWGHGILDDIAAGYESSPTLHAWLQAGGASLCSRAAAALALSR
ncbi:MAG: transglycosylase SLT domain-containing protein [Anaerolineales bacterium]|jgi:soluble lytic murein transglycosylase-like protein